MKKPIDCYQLLSCNLFWFVTFWLTNPKYDLWDIFPLIFCPWTQIYMQNAKRRTNIVFSNSLRSYVNVMMVDFKRLYLLLFLNSAWKFVFRDKNWVEKMPHKSYFGLVSQNITNQKQASTDTDIYRPVPKLFKYRYQYRWPIFIQTIGLCFYIVVEDGV